ncbi:MAG: recombinase family protein [Bacteroidaceae bacterium]|nr:recombinase family protein [Bacteroidaceae bacterium]
MKKAIIYARVSSVTDRQSTDRQVLDLRPWAASNGYEVVKEYTEHISGAKKNSERTEFVAAMAEAEAVGATILFSELSRAGRSIVEVQRAVADMAEQGVNAFFQKENIFLLDGDGKYSAIMAVIISCLAMCAQLERENIKFRLNSGLSNAIAKRGEVRGRKQGSKKSKEQKAVQYKEVLRLLRRGTSIRNTAKLCEVSPRTVQNLKKEFKI